MRNKSRILIISTLLFGCYSDDSVNTNYVSPEQYKNYSCEQVSKEMQRVSKRLDETSKQDMTNKVIDSAVMVFSISQGYGYDDNNNSESARLKSSYDALEQVSIQKNCK